MNNHYTIEELIAELTRVAAERGWGAQLPTNISEILPDSQHVRLLHGDEKDSEMMQNELEIASRDARHLGYEVENLERERDALRNRVEELVGEVLTLKEEARQ